MTVTIGFEKLRFIGRVNDQVRDAHGLSGRVTIGFEKLRFIGESHDRGSRLSGLS